ncbi:hypothetical protein KKG58_03485 [Patescibacteria group bacterium]|nr:hypothetical protein [Patescibacteria group bacterium]
MKQKHIHFIGICGVGMGAIAVMMKKMGWRVTGSDKGFFSPMSDFLKNHQIDFYPGWHPEKIKHPNIIVVGNFISLKNPEYLFAKEKNLTIKSYPELVSEYIIKKNSIVVAGTYGKTTIAAFLTHLFKNANLEPSWFVGGLAKNLKSGAENNQGDWSIVEGDEYTTARWDTRPKFLLYKPTHLILTSVIWDHLDVFPTEKKYDGVFKKLIKLIPKNGQIIAAKRKGEQKINKLVKLSKAEVIRYGKKDLIGKNGYGYEINKFGDLVSKFIVYYNGKILNKFTTSLLGEHLVENLCAGIAMAHSIGIDLKIIQKAVASFQGVKRRLEIKKEVNKIKIIDDIAHSPSKAQASLMAVKIHFPQAKIFAVYEPNVGNRTISSQKFYSRVFNQADYLIIPRLSKTKTDARQEKRMDGQELANIIKQKNKETKVLYLENDDKLVDFLINEVKPKDVIIFLGSHGFRGMIEQTGTNLNPALSKI